MQIRQGLQEMRRVLKANGVAFLFETKGTGNAAEDRRVAPISTVLYGVSLFHCMPVSLGQEGLQIFIET